jgi:DNA-binding transcriptional regulator YiaG
MSKTGTTRVSVKPGEKLPLGNTDWARLDAMTDEEVRAAALSDPDAQPLGPERLARTRRVSRVKVLRQRLAMTQAEFAEAFHLPITTLRDWEQIPQRARCQTPSRRTQQTQTRCHVISCRWPGSHRPSPLLSSFLDLHLDRNGNALRLAIGFAPRDLARFLCSRNQALSHPAHRDLYPACPQTNLTENVADDEHVGYSRKPARLRGAHRGAEGGMGQRLSLERGIEGGWLRYGSTTAPGSVWIAGVSPRGPWLLSIDHSGVAAEIGALAASPMPGPGLATFSFPTLAQLHAALDRVYKLAVSLPEAPLERFQAKIKGLPQTTEAERLVIQRIGQDVFRDALMAYWGSRCPLTGITEPALLRASRIVPRADCTDAQRLDVHNGLLLSALWDAAFDRGLVSFAEDGSALASAALSGPARKALDTEPRRLPACATRTARIWRSTGNGMGFDRRPLMFGRESSTCRRRAA